MVDVTVVDRGCLDRQMHPDQTRNPAKNSRKRRAALSPAAATIAGTRRETSAGPVRAPEPTVPPPWGDKGSLRYPLSFAFSQP